MAFCRSKNLIFWYKPLKIYFEDLFFVLIDNSLQLWFLWRTLAILSWGIGVLTEFVAHYQSYTVHTNYQGGFYSGSTVDNKKTRTPCFSTLRISRISPEPHDLQKIDLHFFISVFKELSAGTEIFQNGGFFLIANFLLENWHFCKYQLILSSDLKIPVTAKSSSKTDIKKCKSIFCSSSSPGDT